MIGARRPGGVAARLRLHFLEREVPLEQGFRRPYLGRLGRFLGELPALFLDGLPARRRAVEQKGVAGLPA